LIEARHQQANRDRSRFSPGGLEARHLTRTLEANHHLSASPKLLVDHDPLVLVLAEGEAFPARLAQSIGRKFGVVALDLGPGPVKPALAELAVEGLSWGRVRLVLIHHHLRSISALERCRRLVHDEACPLPILIAGSREDVELKRNRAMAAGAMDHLVVEPFNVQSVIHALDEAIRIFG
jgi:CheY-like chemotaxis protein